MDSKNISSPSKTLTLNNYNSITPEGTSESNNNSHKKETEKSNLNKFFTKDRQFDTKDTFKAKRKLITKVKNRLYNNKIFNEIKFEINDREIDNYLLSQDLTYGKMLENKKYMKFTKEMFSQLYYFDIQVNIDFAFIEEWERQKELYRKQNREKDKVSELVRDMMNYLSELFKQINEEDNIKQINTEAIPNQNEDYVKKISKEISTNQNKEPQQNNEISEMINYITQIENLDKYSIYNYPQCIQNDEDNFIKERSNKLDKNNFIITQNENCTESPRNNGLYGKDYYNNLYMENEENIKEELNPIEQMRLSPIEFIDLIENKYIKSLNDDKQNEQFPEINQYENVDFPLQKFLELSELKIELFQLKELNKLKKYIEDKQETLISIKFITENNQNKRDKLFLLTKEGKLYCYIINSKTIDYFVQINYLKHPLCFDTTENYQIVGDEKGNATLLKGKKQEFYKLNEKLIEYSIISIRLLKYNPGKVIRFIYATSLGKVILYTKKEKKNKKGSTLTIYETPDDGNFHKNIPFEIDLINLDKSIALENLQKKNVLYVLLSFAQVVIFKYESKNKFVPILNVNCPDNILTPPIFCYGKGVLPLTKIEQSQTYETIMSSIENKFKKSKTENDELVILKEKSSLHNLLMIQMNQYLHLYELLESAQKKEKIFVELAKYIYDPLNLSRNEYIMDIYYIGFISDSFFVIIDEESIRTIPTINFKLNNEHKKKETRKNYSNTTKIEDDASVLKMNISNMQIELETPIKKEILDNEMSTNISSSIYVANNSYTTFKGDKSTYYLNDSKCSSKLKEQSIDSNCYLNNNELKEMETMYFKIKENLNIPAINSRNRIILTSDKIVFYGNTIQKEFILREWDKTISKLIEKDEWSCVFGLCVLLVNKDQTNYIFPSGISNASQRDEFFVTILNKFIEYITGNKSENISKNEELLLLKMAAEFSIKINKVEVFLNLAFEKYQGESDSDNNTTKCNKEVKKEFFGNFDDIYHLEHQTETPSSKTTDLNIFYKTLEHFIFANCFKEEISIPENIVKHIIERYIKTNNFLLLSELLSHFNPKHLQEKSINKIIKEYKLINPIIQINHNTNNLKKSLYKPVEEIFKYFNESNSNGNYSSCFTTDYKSLFSQEMFQCQEYFGHKLFWYCNLLLNGKVYHSDKQIPKDIHKAQIIKIALFLNENAKTFLKFDSFSYFYLLKRLFTEDNLFCTIEKDHGQSKHVRSEAHDSPTFVNKIKKICFELSDNFFILKDFYDFLSELCLNKYPHLEKVINMDLLVKGILFNADYLNETANHFNDPFSCHHQEISKYDEERNKLEEQIIIFISEMKKTEKLSDSDKTIINFKLLNFPNAKVQFLNLICNYEEAIQLKINLFIKKENPSNQDKVELFEWIEKSFDDTENVPEEQEKLANKIICVVPDLCDISFDSFVYLSKKRLFKYKHQIIRQLETNLVRQLKYLETMQDYSLKPIQDNFDYTRSSIYTQIIEDSYNFNDNESMYSDLSTRTSSTLSSSLSNISIDFSLNLVNDNNNYENSDFQELNWFDIEKINLLCKLRKNSEILDILKQNESLIYNKEIFNLLVSNKVYDSVIYIYSSTGNYQKAIELTCKCIESLYKNMVMNITSEKFREQKNIKLLERYNMYVEQGISICQTASDKIDPDDCNISTKKQWIKVLYTLYKNKSNISQYLKQNINNEKTYYYMKINEILNSSTELTLSRMCDYISLQNVLIIVEKDLQEFSITFGEFKQLLIKTIFSLNIMTPIFQKIKSMLRRFVMKMFYENKTLLSKGTMIRQKRKCALCNTYIKTFNDKENLLMHSFLCGHYYHDDCVYINDNEETTCYICTKKDYEQSLTVTKNELENYQRKKDKKMQEENMKKKRKNEGNSDIENTKKDKETVNKSLLKYKLKKKSKQYMEFFNEYLN